jgi:hypothetical protein
VCHLFSVVVGIFTNNHYLHTPQVPPSLLQCLQYLQFLQALQLLSPLQVALASALSQQLWAINCCLGVAGAQAHIIAESKAQNTNLFMLLVLVYKDRLKD